MTETNETPAPSEPESRPVRRARERKAEKDKRRRAQLAGAPIKKARRAGGLRSDVKMVKRTIGGMLLELRNMVTDIQQKAELQNILNECVAKAALGRLTDEDKAVLDDYLDECEQARKEKEAEKPVQAEEPPTDMSTSVFGTDVPAPGPADSQAG